MRPSCCADRVRRSFGNWRASVGWLLLALVLHVWALGWSTLRPERSVDPSQAPMLTQVDLLRPAKEFAVPASESTLRSGVAQNPPVQTPRPPAAMPLSAEPSAAAPPAAAPPAAAPLSAEPPAAEPATEEPATAQPQVVQPPTEGPAAAQSPAGQPPASEAPSAEPSAAEPAPSAAPLPAPSETRSTRRFRVYFGDYTVGQSVARMQFQLEVAAPHYVLRTVGEAEGLLALVYSGALTQESRGRIGLQGLEPEQYEEIRGSRRARSVRLDRSSGMLLPQGGAPVAMPPGTQDRLSVLFQLGLMARDQPERFIAGRSVDVPVAGLRDVRLERFDIVGEAVLIVRDRPVRALHLRRDALAGGRDPSVQVWLGYDADLHPVRVRLEDARGQVLDQVIDEQ